MDESIWLSLAIIHITAVVTPGANFLAVTQTALTRSRQAGLWVARGVITGSLIHVAAGMIGFAAVISQIPLLFAAIRLLGGLYFAYAGFKMLKAAYVQFRSNQTMFDMSHVPTQTKLSDLTPAEAYRRGLFTHLSNPASMLYYVSLFTGFVPVSATLIDKLLIAVALLGTTAVWYLLVAIMFSQERIRQFYFRLMASMNGLFGVLWIALAAKLIFA
jgi:threonine/homoserine/homoserine lactone efflux protein